MFVCYMLCNAVDHIALGEYGWEREQYPAEYTIAYDPSEPGELEYELEQNDCLWIVPSATPWI